LAITGLHFLLTYQCTNACDHCFVFGSPEGRGDFSLELLRRAFEQAEALGSVESVAFEGGEPFLLYPLLCAAAQEGSKRHWRVEAVTNGYWATSEAEAGQLLAPLAAAGMSKISISDDALHGNAGVVRHASVAAEKLGMSCSTLTTHPLSVTNGKSGGRVMHRGRAAVTLANDVPQRDWHTFDRCPFETLESPRRVHLDAGGHVHVCQGLLMGNWRRSSLSDVVNAYSPLAHPVVGPLLAGGPAQLVRSYDLPHLNTYADACHLCYEMRRQLRQRFPDLLGPGQVYGDIGCLE
jgi:hypothetical protein